MFPISSAENRGEQTGKGLDLLRLTSPSFVYHLRKPLRTRGLDYSVLYQDPVRSGIESLHPKICYILGFTGMYGALTLFSRI